MTRITSARTKSVRCASRKMPRLAAALLFVLTAAISLAGHPLRGHCAESAARPNIIVILSDDMGYSDVGCYGGEIETPTLDALAAGGLRFTQFYNTARCCPTRACLLSGLYPHQAGVGHMTNDRGFDGYRGDLNRNCVTIAEVLRPAGYATFMAGKWHVTKHTHPEGPKDNWPLQRGFDKFYGTITGAGSFFDPATLVRGNTMITVENDPEYAPRQYYYTDAIADNAVKFLAEHEASQSEKPFFMYMAFTAAHWPMHALDRDVAKYRGVYDGGYGPTRAARFAQMKKLGLIDPRWEMSPQAGDWGAVRNREWEVRCMEVYAAMVDSMDQGIGRVVAQLRKTGRLDDTLILYLQDNGGCAEGLGRASRGRYTTRPDAPVFAPMGRDEFQPHVVPTRTRDGFPVVQGPGVMPGPADTYIAYGRGWANVSNTPFREYKHWVHEGGISTPLVAHWPAGIERTGQLERQPGHLVDLMATCVDLSGAEYPVAVGDNPIKPMEGRSLVPALAGDAIEREAIYWEHEGNRAVRAGKWKLVAKGAGGPWELYDVEADRTEMHDRAAEEPDRAAELAELWLAYAERANVLPLNPRGNRKPAVFSKKRRFVLRQGDNLHREKAPQVQGRALTISTTIDAKSADGVIVAQGGDAHGFSLYLKLGKLQFATRHDGRFSLVAADAALPNGPVAVVATLDKKGQVTLTVDGRPAATGNVPGPLSSMPLDGLQVGRDESASVGEYESPNPLDGTIENTVVELGE